MRRIGLAFVLTVAIAAPAIADSNVTTRRLGNTTYLNGRSAAGETFTGSSRQLGNQRNTTIREGNRTTNCTTRTFGGQTTTSCR